MGLGKKFVLRYVLSGEETESKAWSLVSVAGIEGHELMTFSHILEAGWIRIYIQLNEGGGEGEEESEMRMTWEWVCSIDEDVSNYRD